MKKLAKYYTERINNLSDLLKLGSSSFTDETFHKLRVEIKKIRFLLKLADFTEGNPDKNTKIKETDKLFKRAGAVRDLQITLPILKRYTNKSSFSSLHKSLSKQIEKRKKKFYRQLDKIKHKSLQKDLYKLKSDLQKVDSGKFTAFEKYLKKKCAKLFRRGKKQSDEDIHSARKLLKLLTYCDKVNEKEEKESRFEKLGDVIGKWHDYLICIEQLNEVKFLPDNISSIKKLRSTLKNRAAKSRAEMLVQVSGQVHYFAA